MAVRKIPHPGVYRRSTLQGFEEDCPRRTRFALQAGDVTTGYSGASALLGQAVHLVLFKIMERLRATGEPQMDPHEAIDVIMDPTLTASDIVLPTREMRDLRWMVGRFVRDYTWRPERIMTLEEMLWADVPCPDGVTRTVTGRPDMIMSDPPDGGIIPDWKSGRGRPRTPRVMPPVGEPIVGTEYLSEHGLFQLKVYGYLALMRFPSFQRVTLREVPLRFPDDPPREATVTRDAVEHMERQLGVIMMQLDRAIAEGPKSDLWRPKPGRYCTTACPVARSCPVPREMRGIGSINSEQQANVAARAWTVTNAQQKQLREALKVWTEESGHHPEVGDGHVLRYEPEFTSPRKWGLHDPVADAPDSPDIDELFQRAVNEMGGEAA